MPDNAPEDLGPLSRRRGGGLYPLWLGLLALAGLLALWFGDDAPAESAAPDAAPAADAGTDARPEAAEDREPTRLEWTIGPRPPMDAGVLDDCLASAGYDRAAAVGIDPIVITYPGRVRPLSLRPSTLDGQPALLLSTPVEADARLSAALHVAATACLYVEGAAVYDPLFDRRATAADWPQLGESGGLPVQHLVQVDAVPGGRVTRGLARLGRPELGVALPEGTDAAAGRRFALLYAAAAVVAPADAERLERSGGFPARLLPEAEARAAGWWTAPPDPTSRRVVLARPDSDPPAPLALPRERPRRPPPAARRPKEAPKATPRAPAPRRPAPTAQPKAPAKPKPRPKAPAPFSPEYR